ncbi:MAG: hypothetical protein ACP5N1_06380 [Candidatus Woesearchaeota archaeon]
MEAQDINNNNNITTISTMKNKITKKNIIEKNVVLRRILGIISLVAIVSNIFLRFALHLYNDAIFWVIIIICAIIAWPVMNYLKK